LSKDIMESRWSLDNVRENGPFPPDELSDSSLAMRSDDADGAARFGPYKRLHRLMRGRYHLMLPALAVAMVVGGVYGWHRSKPVYRAEGLVQVANSLPKVLAPTDQNEPLDMFEEFVQAQVVLMTSRVVIASAIGG
jgi:uncharacterized protein involved in exopolysaccharide biosynthesis